jgi:ferrous iron transport protein B
MSQLTTELQAAFPGLPNARWVALRLLDGDERIAEAVARGELGDLAGPRAQPDLELALEAG